MAITSSNANLSSTELVLDKMSRIWAKIYTFSSHKVNEYG